MTIPFSPPFEGILLAYPEDEPPISATAFLRFAPVAGFIGAGWHVLSKASISPRAYGRVLGTRVSGYSLVGVMGIGVVKQIWQRMFANIDLQEKDMEMPYRGWYERSPRYFDNDDAMIVGALLGVGVALLHTRRFGLAMRKMDWVGSAGFGCCAGFVGRTGYAFLSDPAGWRARRDRDFARKQEAARWQRDVQKTIEKRFQKDQ